MMKERYQSKGSEGGLKCILRETFNSDARYIGQGALHLMIAGLLTYKLPETRGVEELFTGSAALAFYVLGISSLSKSGDGSHDTPED